MPLDLCTLVGDSGCCFAGQASVIIVRGEGPAVFATPEPFSVGRADRVELVGVRVGSNEPRDVVAAQPRFVEPLPMSLDGQLYTVTYHAGTPIRIAADLPLPPSDQAASTTLLADIPGAAQCAAKACPILWNGTHRVVKLYRSAALSPPGGGPMPMTGRFPFGEWDGTGSPPRLIEVRVAVKSGLLQCNADGGVWQIDVQGEQLIWSGGVDNALVMDPVHLDGDLFSVMLRNSAPPERSPLEAGSSAVAPPSEHELTPASFAFAVVIVLVLAIVAALVWSRRRALELVASNRMATEKHGSPDHAQGVPSTSSPAPVPPAPSPLIELFYSYAPEDRPLRDRLAEHLAFMKNSGLIREWHDQCVDPGTGYAAAVDAHVESADVILLLVSSSYAASDSLWNRQMRRAIERHERGEATLLPVLVRPCAWQDAPFADLLRATNLPGDDDAVSTASNEDAALTRVVEGIRRAVEARRSIKAARVQAA